MNENREDRIEALEQFIGNMETLRDACKEEIQEATFWIKQLEKKWGSKDAKGR